MDDLKRILEAPPDNVIDLFDPARRPLTGVTRDELAEYRRIRPMLLLLAQRAPELMALMREWQTLKGSTGCPVMASILPPD